MRVRSHPMIQNRRLSAAPTNLSASLITLQPSAVAGKTESSLQLKTELLREL